MTPSLARLLALAAACVAAPAVAADTGAWQVGPMANAPGSCTANLDGEKIDLILLVNNKNQLVLTAGHKDWGDASGEVMTQLAIDGGPAEALPASTLGTLVLGTVDSARFARLRAARSIDWTLPKGTFHVAVTGLGAAFDAVGECQKAAKAGG